MHSSRLALSFIILVAGIWLVRVSFSLGSSIGVREARPRSKTLESKREGIRFVSEALAHEKAPVVTKEASAAVLPSVASLVAQLLDRKLSAPRISRDETELRRNYEEQMKDLVRELGLQPPLEEAKLTELHTRLCLEKEVGIACDYASQSKWAEHARLLGEANREPDPQRKAELMKRAQNLATDASDRALRACVEGVGWQCYEAYRRLRGTPEHAKLEELSLRHCQDGMHWSCVSTSIALRSIAEADDRRFCEGRSGCFPPSESERKDAFARAADLERTNCRNGFSHACFGLITDPVYQADHQGEREQALKQLHVQCSREETRYATRNPCEFLISAHHKRGESEFAQAIAERDCERGKAASCLMRGKLSFLDGQETAAGPAETMSRLERYCEVLQVSGGSSTSPGFCGPLLRRALTPSDFWRQYRKSLIIEPVNQGSVTLEDYLRDSEKL